MARGTVRVTAYECRTRQAEVFLRAAAGEMIVVTNNGVPQVEIRKAPADGKSVAGALEALLALRAGELAAADAYFATRSRNSQLGAWTSRQSRPLASRDQLLADFKRVGERFAGRDVPRPPHWTGDQDRAPALRVLGRQGAPAP